MAYLSTAASKGSTLHILGQMLLQQGTARIYGDGLTLIDCIPIPSTASMLVVGRTTRMIGLQPSRKGFGAIDGNRFRYFPPKVRGYIESLAQQPSSSSNLEKDNALAGWQLPTSGRGRYLHYWETQPWAMGRFAQG